MKPWRISQTESRLRYLAKFDAAEAARYDSLAGTLSPEESAATLAGIQSALGVAPPLAERLRNAGPVLDAGAGTGALSACLLTLDPNLPITALEPAPAMLDRLRAKPALHSVETRQGFCDAPSDQDLFPESQRFGMIFSRQLVNGLYDPLAAFRNFHHWLAPGGMAVILDGAFARDAWSGIWEEEVDTLPVSACQSAALIPYLLEVAGFRIEAVQWMEAVNRLPSTRTRRYLVAASKSA